MAEYLLWGSELSPFALKTEAMLRYAALPYRWLPSEGSTLENLRTIVKLVSAARNRNIHRFDGMTALDEYPQVPFLLTPDGEITYDSSAIALWLDSEVLGEVAPLVPSDPGLAFICRLLDETFDEFGLYMVHHMRWVGSAGNNDAGERLAEEFRSVIPGALREAFASRFARRQVRRLPYLFSIAPADLSQQLDRTLRAPAPSGWPATHGMLEQGWETTLANLEALLAGQPYLLGERFTLADASLYGELAINTDDEAANRLMQELAPASHDWVRRIRQGKHGGSSGPLAFGESLKPFLVFAMEVFVPLMEQNARAWQQLQGRGQRVYNEAAINKGVALYDGELCGQPYRSVVKTFQVRVWQDLCRLWQDLPVDSRQALQGMLPGSAAFTPAASDADSARE